MNPSFWDGVYKQKNDSQLSWFEEVPKASLQLIAELKLSEDSRVIDIGGGDSRLVDHLLALGFRHISVLDISAEAIGKAKARLQRQADAIEWIVSDVTQFQPSTQYDLWHDRATFHFLTTAEEVDQYLNVAHSAIKQNGFLIVSTFAKTGPEQCSGLPIHQYSEGDLKFVFGKYFSNIKCFESSHQTPWGAKQDFTFCGFKRTL